MGILSSAARLVRPMFTLPEDQQAEGADYVREESILGEVRDLRDSALRLRIDEEREWLRAWNFYKGRHWITWREDRWVESEANDRPKIVVNFVEHVVTTRLGHLLKNRPILMGVPMNADEESRNATRLALKVLEAYHYKLKMPRKYADIVLHTAVTGKCYAKVGWDPYAGGSWKRPGVAGQPDAEGILGDLTTDVCRRHEVLPEPGATTIADAQRVVHRTFWPIAKVRRLWGDRAKDLQPIDPSTREGGGILRQLYGFDGAVPAAVHDRVEVMEVLYRKGTSRPEGGEFEEGLRAIFAGDKLMQAGGTPAGFPEIPLAEFDELRTDTIESTSVARQIIDLNKVFDVELSQQEHNRKVLRPKTLMPYQANVSKEAWDKTDDEVVEYFHPYEPKAYTPPTLPAHHVEIRKAIENLIKELGGNFDVMGGGAKSDVRSGRQVAYLQEYAGTVLGVTAQNLEQGSEDIGNMQLQILREYAREDRLLPLVGRHRRMEVVAFKGETLRGCSGVQVQVGSAIPISRAEKFDRIENWMEKGWVDPAKGIKALDMADPDLDFYAEDEQYREIADEVIYRLRNATPQALMEAEQAASAAANQRNIGFLQAGLAEVPRSERDVLRALKIEAFDFEDHAKIMETFTRGYLLTHDYRDAGPQIRGLADAFRDWHALLASGIDPDLPVDPTTGEAGKTMHGASKGAAEAQAAAAGAAPGGAGGGPGGGLPPVDGSPMALKGGTPPGGGGVGGGHAEQAAAQGGAEAHEGLPPVRRVPPPHGV